MENFDNESKKQAERNKAELTAQEVALFVRAAVRVGCRYLSVGGPTSRLEDRLTKAGERLGFKTEIFTTPTGVFVSALTPSRQKVITFVGRVKEVMFSMTELETMEGILHKLASGEMTPEQALYFVKMHDSESSPREHLTRSSGAFLIGFIAALFSYGSVLISTVSGLITVLIYFLSGPVTNHYKLNPVFSNFISAIIGFGLAAISAHFLNISMQAVSLGGLIILAPGLMITTAISEIAEQNYVSGIAKLMKSSIHLCGLLVAYLLVNDLVTYSGLMLDQRIPVVDQVIPYAVLRYAFYGLLVAGMCLSLQVPSKAIPGAMAASFVSWIVFNQFTDPHYYVSATYVASLSVGLVSLCFGYFMKLPSQIFSTPGILALVPGVLAMSSFQGLAILNEESLQTGLKVILIASAIVFGLFTSRVPYLMSTKDEFGLAPEEESPEPQIAHEDVKLDGLAEASKKFTVSPNSESSISIF